TIETVETCSDLCSNGACVDITCRNDHPDCDDFNDRTKDTCVNPGTTASFCTNTPMNCLSDNDCGFTGYLGDEFCSQNDVYKNYQNAKCNNPGTLNSSCSINLIPSLIQDCDDNNLRTLDSCVEPPARCIHIIPLCFSNSECSSGGSSSNSFCSGNQFWINITKPVCLNPGKINAACSFNSKALFFEDCQFGCSNGKCNMII
ncbi:MAG: hypothetical protein NT076_03510, partial [Candidatus Pacearchaeota archaeon]|nr:hypothetical protein [Candidatus Pacearchaeota archaeon]